MTRTVITAAKVDGDDAAFMFDGVVKYLFLLATCFREEVVCQRTGGK
jgi:hypothetical protein